MLFRLLLPNTEHGISKYANTELKMNVSHLEAQIKSNDVSQIVGRWPVEGAVNCKGWTDEAQLQLTVIREAT